MVNMSDVKIICEVASEALRELALTLEYGQVPADYIPGEAVKHFDLLPMGEVIVKDGLQ